MKQIQESMAPTRDHGRMENTMGNLLRLGVLLSAAVVLAGGILYLFHRGSQVADYRSFAGETSEYRGLRDIVTSALSLRPVGIVQFGVLLLIATPVARVFYALFTFIRERDRRFIVITLIVAAVLMYGFLGGKA